MHFHSNNTIDIAPTLGGGPRHHWCMHGMQVVTTYALDFSEYVHPFYFATPGCRMFLCLC